MPDREKNTIAVLILAAGGSTRMGKPKQLLPWKHTTLLGHAVEQIQRVLKDIFVVLGANEEEIRTGLGNAVVPIYNPDWKKGIGTSIATGIQRITADDYDAVLILLADQPLMETRYYSQMIDHFGKGSFTIIATHYGSKCGVPALFDRTHFAALQDLHADFGAQKIIKKYPEELYCIDPQGKEADVDTVELYERLFKIKGNPDNDPS